MAQSLCSTHTVVLQQILSSLSLLLLRTPVGVQEELGFSGGASGTAPHLSSNTDFNNQVPARPIISSEEEEGISAMIWDMDDRQLEENEDPRRLESLEW